MEVLHTSGTDATANAWLRDSIGVATADLFTGMAVLSVLILLALLAVPRRFARTGQGESTQWQQPAPRR